MNFASALSSGYLPYHLRVMRERPDLVASFEQFNDANPFKPIKLGGAIRQPDDYNKSHTHRHHPIQHADAVRRSRWEPNSDLFWFGQRHDS
jgi:hypothetical protein